MNLWPFKKRDERGRFRKEYPALPEPGEEDEEEEILEGEFSEILGDEPIYGFAAEKQLPPVTVRELVALSQEEGGEPEYEDVTLKEYKPGRSRSEEPSLEQAKALRERQKRLNELKRIRLEAQKARVLADKAKHERDITAAQKAKFELRKAQAETGMKYATRAATLGGVPAVQRKGGIRDLYFGRARRSLYVPATPQVEEGGTAGEALRPHLEMLRRAGAPATGQETLIAQTVMPGASPIAVGPNYGFLREKLMLKGVSPLEKVVFAEIEGNHDVDTMDHIQDEVQRLGYGRKEIGQAVRSLEKQGFVEKQKLLPSGQTEYVIRR